MCRYAVIDLGTNTFHLLIAQEKADGTIEELYRERIYVKLAEEGIVTIGAAPFQRGLQALLKYKITLEKFEVKQVHAFGTAALRTASNGEEFTQIAKAKTGIEIRLIPGAEEARLIHKGVSQAVDIQQDKVLIMDIGGGSVEFIIANQEGVIWAESFPIGVALLFNAYHHNDPISSSEIEQLERNLEDQLQSLLQILSQHQLPYLIGASGTFDVLENTLVKDKLHPLHAKISREDFLHFYKQLIFSTTAERFAMSHIPNARVEMIIVALVLIRFVLQKAKCEHIIISAYAMKEGILKEMMDH